MIYYINLVLDWIGSTYILRSINSELEYSMEQK